jgi:hypothetical protein
LALLSQHLEISAYLKLMQRLCGADHHNRKRSFLPVALFDNPSRETLIESGYAFFLGSPGAASPANTPESKSCFRRRIVAGMAFGLVCASRFRKFLGEV